MITVKEFIEQLQNYDQDAFVMFGFDDMDKIWPIRIIKDGLLPFDKDGNRIRYKSHAIAYYTDATDPIPYGIKKEELDIIVKAEATFKKAIILCRS